MFLKRTEKNVTEKQPSFLEETMDWPYIYKSNLSKKKRKNAPKSRIYQKFRMNLG